MLNREDIDALSQLEREPHGYKLDRFSRSTGVIDVTDRRLKDFIRERTGKADRRGPIGVDVYACRVGRKQRQFGLTMAEAVKAAIKGAPIY